MSELPRRYNERDIVQLDYDEERGTITLNLPKDILDKIDKVIVTVFQQGQVAQAAISKFHGHLCPVVDETAKVEEIGKGDW